MDNGLRAKEHFIPMNKKGAMYVIMTILLLAGSGYLMLGKSSEIERNNVVIGNGGSGDFQKVVLGMKNYNYYPNTINVKAGQPVRIYLDESVIGCYRGFTIRDFKIAKYLKTPEDYVEFTPKEPGTYGFSCSMGMGRGTLIVE